ncbi:MAG: glycosyltransferase [Chloroflexi bacterium]|nr:glycosyltransferase [Thermoleophilia bacterium]MCU0484058.1 glycosyltransferase [Chloroflexota bacterium]
MSGGQRPLRIAMYVRNDVRHDARVLREATTLVAAGHSVTIVGRRADRGDVPAREVLDGATIVRVRESTAWRASWRQTLAEVRAPWLARHRLRRGLARGASRVERAEAVRLAVAAAIAWPWVAYRLADRLATGGRLPAPGRDGDLDRLVRWREDARRWAAAAAAAAPEADVHHGHDLPGLMAAVEAARDGGLIVYDSHELYVESGSQARLGRLAKAWMRRLEGRLARSTVALVTVNETLASVLDARLRPGRVVVVHNAPPRWEPPDPPPGLLRDRLGLPPSARIVLYHGGLIEGRGLRQLVDAVLEPGMEDTHLVLLGAGPLWEELAARAATPRAGGRVHLLEAVLPDQLPEWVAAADVGVMPNQPVNANERLSTPNKLFESIAVGLPVVSSDFPERRRIILGDPDGPLGAVCDPTDPAAIAAAIRSILDLGPAERADLRARILRAAHARWNWETEGARLVRLYEEIAVADVAAERAP